MISPFVVDLVYIKCMENFLTINGKSYSHKQINLIRDFFTDDQWTVIDGALSEFKDHDPDYLEEVYGSENILTETLDIISEVYRSAY